MLRTADWESKLVREDEAAACSRAEADEGRDDGREGGRGPAFEGAAGEAALVEVAGAALAGAGALRDVEGAPRSKFWPGAFEPCAGSCVRCLTEAGLASPACSLLTPRRWYSMRISRFQSTGTYLSP